MSLINVRELPLAEISLRRISASCSSGSMADSCKIFITSARGLNSISASRMALAAPLRTNSVLLRSPQSWANALTIMDLPAPVSPVMMFKPSENSMRNSSIKAKFLMYSDFNIAIFGLQRIYLLLIFRLPYKLNKDRYPMQLSFPKHPDRPNKRGRHQRPPFRRSERFSASIREPSAR